MGRPPYLTPEEREASRIRQNKKRSKRSRAKRAAMRAARAIAEGREPGKVGQPRMLTDAERAANRKETFRKYRERNLQRLRERDAGIKRTKRALRAVADGRPVGRIGRIKFRTDEEILERNRKNALSYWEKFPERRKELGKKYYAANKEQVQANVRNRRARKRGNGGKHTAADIRALWDKQHGICAFCSRPLGEKKPHVDHWIPLIKGGSNGPENLRLLHGPCNLKKAKKLPSYFGLSNY